MTSQINPANINGAYPVAGQDNSSQGFRDNFTNTKTNFQFAASEITALQNNVILTGNISGVTLTNNMNYQPLVNAQITGFSERVSTLGTQTAISVAYANGHYQTVTLGGSNLAVSFSGWPAVNQFAWVTVAFTVTAANQTVTLPNTVTLNTAGIQGFNPATGVIAFAAPGIYTFTFSTINNGTNIAIAQNNNQLAPLNNSAQSVATTQPAGLTTTTSWFTGAGISSLAAGVAGQIKVLTQTQTGTMVVTVATPGWAGTGTITLALQGDGCTLQYTNGAWYCIGNNGAVFG